MFLSSGTWSLLGVENRSPLTTAAAYGENFTNEGGYHFRYRFLKNIMGLWMIQSIRRELNGITYVVDEKAIRKGRLHQYMRVEGLGQEVGFEDLIRAADEAECAGVQASIVNVNDDRFLSPDSMIEEILEACEETGQAVPQTLGELMLCVYESLARCYREAVEGLSSLAGHGYKSINIVGGGCRDGHLNRRTAEVCGLPVYAGPVEGTALGNLPCRCSPTGCSRTSRPSALPSRSPSTCRRWNRDGLACIRRFREVPRFLGPGSPGDKMWRRNAQKSRYIAFRKGREQWETLYKSENLQFRPNERYISRFLCTNK